MLRSSLCLCHVVLLCMVVPHVNKGGICAYGEKVEAYVIFDKWAHVGGGGKEN